MLKELDPQLWKVVVVMPLLYQIHLSLHLATIFLHQAMDLVKKVIRYTRRFLIIFQRTEGSTVNGKVAIQEGICKVNPLGDMLILLVLVINTRCLILMIFLANLLILVPVNINKQICICLFIFMITILMGFIPFYYILQQS